MCLRFERERGSCTKRSVAAILNRYEHHHRDQALAGSCVDRFRGAARRHGRGAAGGRDRAGGNHVERCVLALPMQSVGLSVEHVRFPGTLTLSAETLLAVLTEIGRSVLRAGIRRLVFLNSHGGQPQVLDLAARALRADGMFAVNCHWGRLGLPPSITLDPVEQRHGFHGGLVETSLMLHLRPQLVRMEHATDFRSAWIEQEERFSVLTPEGRIGFGWETQDLHPAGALGNAGAATAEAGRAILEHAASRLVQLWDEVRRLDVAAWMRAGPVA
jgi:creatinine amidohydrolase